MGKRLSLTGTVCRSDVSYESILTTSITVRPEKGQVFSQDIFKKNVKMVIPGRHILGGRRIRAEYVVDAKQSLLVQYYEILGRNGEVVHSDSVLEGSQSSKQSKS